ncbi:type I-B CRISPR-associated protein Cas7/Cst2/DevR [Carnobacterium gallinarum]|uniref:type I-B CRISPR-associated protein Cas7/Cst2/DevR n=1 Tax=Carnobacterium gallinarum TaxID=2749 RepID=UPI0005568C30|nr:type I-B CRISPR-associated protein Cas7/Cst2/DevR [Carnobacterium gallinarum]
MKKVSGVTLTILTESPIALSNDQGFGNYTPIKKYFFKDGIHAMTSVATFTYELRKCLFENFGWSLSDLTVKKSNSYFNDVDLMTEKGFEADIFGFLLPDQQVSKTSPLRVIPFTSVSTFKNDTQLITNRGFLNIDLKRNRFDEKGKELEIEDVPRTQALANEEVFGDYYTYTLTIELDRIGVAEVKKDEKGKYQYLEPNERSYMSPELRMQAVDDILNAVTILTRDIKHQRVLLKPLAVFGGAFEQVIPYFWNDMILESVTDKMKIDTSFVDKTIADYKLENVIKAMDKNLMLSGEQETVSPVQAIQQLAKCLTVGEDNQWYLEE